MNPAARATSAAASSDICGVAMRMLATLARRGSPGLGVSAAGLASCFSTRRRGIDAGICRSTARASAWVVASATVGPEAITERSSPGTSEMIRLTTRAGAAATRESAALDRRQMLAHAIHLADMRAAAQQRAIDRLLVGERDVAVGQGEQRRAAARDEAQHEIVGAERPCTHSRMRARGGRPGGVGNGMGAPRRP